MKKLRVGASSKSKFPSLNFRGGGVGYDKYKWTKSDLLAEIENALDHNLELVIADFPKTIADYPEARQVYRNVLDYLEDTLPDTIIDFRNYERKI